MKAWEHNCVSCLVCFDRHFKRMQLVREMIFYTMSNLCMSPDGITKNTRSLLYYFRVLVLMVKINVDAAVGRARGAAGAICRDQDGAFLGASAVVFSHLSDPGTLEMLAIREALALADDI